MKTRWALILPLARAPGFIPGSFTVLGIIAIVLALLGQSFFVAEEGGPVGESFAVSGIALLAGLAGAKLWYAILHPGPWRKALLGGWAVDGFLVAASFSAIAVLVGLDRPIGAYLDATTPGMFLAVTIGRFGCFLTGCCAGRCSDARWAVWSYDRDSRIGARRIPTQLLESAAGLTIAILSALVLLSDVAGPSGAVFGTAVGSYFVIRQGLLRLRADRREYLWRRSRLASGNTPSPTRATDTF